MDVEIKRVGVGELDELFGLVERFATSFKPETAAFDVAARELIEREDAWLGGAYQAGGLVGYCLGFDHLTFYANGRVAWVEEIMVSETCRRLGIGKSLMTAFEAWARSRDSKVIGLATRRAAPFYEALGYEPSATYYRRLL